MSVVVVPYDPGWPVQFEAIRTELADALAGVPVVGIEHVGSTSVPGLAAKPVIDVDVIVERPYVLPAIEALEQVGYRYRGNLGIEDRDWMQEPGGVRRNVYVTVSGCLSVRNHLGVRETLRAREDLREQYGTLKLELSQRDWENRDDYTAAKSEILQEILAAAGLGDADRAAIDAANVPDSPDS